MSLEIPEQLKADVPATTFGKILSATPVVMTVVATLLAGLSSSEMTRAQYDRSWAAQKQSKAGDQWGYFQAKRMRGLLQNNSLEMLQSTTEVPVFSASAFRQAIEQGAGGADTKTALVTLLDSAEGKVALSALEKGELPAGPAAVALDPKITVALDAIEAAKPEAEVLTLVAAFQHKELELVSEATRSHARAFDAAVKPTMQTLDRMEKLVTQWAKGGAESSRTALRGFIAARLRLLSLRYEAEARLNQAVANIYELQVRLSNITADRHHARSERFFYGMLGAQLAVIVSTLAMAARKRSLLWSVAAVAGLTAIVFAIYVYVWL